MKCDLHCHSVFSDGTSTPEEIVALAKENNAVVALCDHNTATGLPVFLAEAVKQGVTAVAGAEFSSEYKGKEVHILALFIPEKHFDRVEEMTRGYRIRKTESNFNLIKRLNEAGYGISFEKLQSEAEGGSFNRAAIAAELKRKGYVSSNQEAFDSVLSKKGGFYIPPRRDNTLDVISFIRSINALPVLSHPLISLSEEELTEFLGEAVNAGLLGMETEYSLYTPEETATAKRLALCFGLLESGGSDFHGENKPDIEFIRGKGNLQVPEEFYNKLLEKSRTLL